MASGQAQRRRVIYPNNGCLSSGVLCLAPGDVLEVKQAEGEWWKGKIVTSGNKTRSPPLQTGFFFSKFTVPVEPNKPAAAVPCLAMNMGNPHSVRTYEENDYISQTPPSDEMTCVICHSLASQPHQTECCEQTMCLTCSQVCRKKTNSCPQCRRAPLRLLVDVRLERTIANLNVHCRNHSMGCDWMGRLGKVKSHLKMNCRFTFVMVECEHRGCSLKFKMPGLDLKKHMASECKQRAVQCPACKVRIVYEWPGKGRLRTLFTLLQALAGINLTYNRLITKHYKECPAWPMRCPNKCPQDNLTRASLQAHLDEDCPEQVISCEFSDVGCGVRLKRRKMKKHLQQAMEQHMKDERRYYISNRRKANVLSVPSCAPAAAFKKEPPASRQQAISYLPDIFRLS